VGQGDHNDAIHELLQGVRLDELVSLAQSKHNTHKNPADSTFPTYFILPLKAYVAYLWQTWSTIVGITIHREHWIRALPFFLKTFYFFALLDLEWNGMPDIIEESAHPIPLVFSVAGLCAHRCIRNHLLGLSLLLPLVSPLSHPSLPSLSPIPLSLSNLYSLFSNHALVNSPCIFANNPLVVWLYTQWSSRYANNLGLVNFTDPDLFNSLTQEQRDAAKTKLGLSIEAARAGVDENTRVFDLDIAKFL
jgi:hypothetical protein